MNRHALKVERRIRLWIAQQEADMSRYSRDGAPGSRTGGPSVRLPSAIELPARERQPF